MYRIAAPYYVPELSHHTPNLSLAIFLALPYSLQFHDLLLSVNVHVHISLCLRHYANITYLKLELEGTLILAQFTTAINEY